MALIHHTELGRLVVRVPVLLAAVWRNVHRVHNLTELCEASAHLSIHVHSYLLHPAKSIKPNLSPDAYLCINPPSLVVL